MMAYNLEHGVVLGPRCVVDVFMLEGILSCLRL